MYIYTVTTWPQVYLFHNELIERDPAPPLPTFIDDTPFEVSPVWTVLAQDLDILNKSASGHSGA